MSETEYEYKILTPAEIRKLKRIFAADPRFQRIKKAMKPAPPKPEGTQDPTAPAPKQPR